MAASVNTETKDLLKATFDQQTKKLLKRLQQRLESCTITRQDLTLRVGVSSSTMGRWKDTECIPSGTARISLKQVLDRLDRRLPLGGHDE